ncbi:MAG: hypothetical protein J0I12_17655 [Candidatus Eremiobacteraeota bacterium]|nr:hypothetical protein [Candidatus Eremiobacteraeota bacterium]
MKRTLLVVFGLLTCFLIGGAGVYRYLNDQGEKPFLRASASDLAGTWKTQTTSLQLKARGDILQVDGADYTRDGKSPRWVEKAPKSQVPRVLDWDGKTLTLTTVEDSGQRRSEVFQRGQ